MKDIPDIKGDKLYKINSFSVRIGAQKMFMYVNNLYILFSYILILYILILYILIFILFNVLYICL